MTKKIVFATRSYQYLSQKILQHLEAERGEVEVRLFPDGERYQRIITDIRGRDVVLVGGTVSDTDTLELFDLACALVKHGASALTLVIPYYGYATMERAVKPGEVVTAKTRARLLSAIPMAAGGNRILLCDLHAEGIPHYFEGNVSTVHLYCKPLVVEACHELAGNDFILACTDAGRAKWVESLANDMGVSAAFVFKRRISGEATAITGINADVQDRVVIIYDDMIRTGGSLLHAAAAYHAAGAREIFVITTHGLFTNNALARIQQSGIVRRVICTDTHIAAVALPQDDFFQVKSVAGLIAMQLAE